MYKIHQRCLDEFAADAKRELPLEACGILAGNGNEITHYFPMYNVDQAHDHFSFDMREAFKVNKQMRKAGLEYLAVIHSHPETPARPSLEDIALANDASKGYLITSFVDEENLDTKAFKIYSVEGEDFKKVDKIPLEIIK